jgi:hypothetical protein
MANGIHGRLTDFRLDDSGGTLRDISNYVNKVSLNRDAPEIDTTTFQDTARTYISDFDGAEISFEGNAHAIVMGYLHPVLGQAATLTFNYGPEGTASGKRKMTGEAVLTALAEDGQATGQQNKFTAKLRVVGAITFTTY